LTAEVIEEIARISDLYGIHPEQLLSRIAREF